MNDEYETRLKRRNHGTGHSYTLYGKPVPGVTTILNVLDKPALVGWAARMSADYAIDHWNTLSEQPLSKRHEAILNARFEKNREATTKGTQIHDMAERLLTTGDAGNVPPNLYTQVKAVADFLDEWEIETIHAEAPIANTTRMYAGTCDSIAYSPKLGTILLDWKTGKGIYPEMALQLAAYAKCDILLTQKTVIGPRGGKHTEWEEVEFPEIDSCYIAHVHVDSVEMHPISFAMDLFEVFQHLLDIYNTWVKKTSLKFRDTPGYMPPIEPAIQASDYPNIHQKEY